MTNHEATVAPTLADVTARIESGAAALDALRGHLLHVADITDITKDEGAAQTCFHLANAVGAIKDEIDAAVLDLGRIRGIRP